MHGSGKALRTAFVFWAYSGLRGYRYWLRLNSLRRTFGDEIMGVFGARVCSWKMLCGYIGRIRD